MGTLYIVPTPVGNMEDMTLRAIRVLKEADVVLAEDTRTSGVLLKHFDIQNRLLSHHKFNEHGTTASVIERLKGGQDVALVSDAGTPGISDPGFFLAREAVRAGITCGSGFRTALRQVLLRRVPASEEGASDHARLPEGRASDDDFLRVALQTAENVRTVCRGVWCRTRGLRMPRDIQTARRLCQGNARGGQGTFREQSAAR